MSRTRGDIYNQIGMRAENNVAKKFAEAGVEPFPEVDLGKASFVSGIPEKRILHALRNRKLRGRRVGDKHMITIVDLWYFAVSLESDGILNKNRR
ncbi:MAG: hypothetical protein HZB99_03955 [Candidatus Harrisonbacteria bacterium]|nr:hypothetical protein [Candidatus Harrisonbacteria bacterium]